MLLKKYEAEGYSLSSFDYLLLEAFSLKNPLRISEIMEYVNNVGFYRKLGIHKPNVEKKRVKHRLSTMQEWELIELLPSKQYKLTEIGLNNIKKYHQILWNKMCARREKLLCLNCGYILTSQNQKCPDCKIKDAQLEGNYYIIDE
ncbi:hypothetical protein NIES267_74060 (plasmid) [Calothrix parasitica NIES-267]|uniref:Transcriptional regulator n=1 Tax=Calothrix parasitica NIES-267 TaxID=1973488 RepID=A0A1Z4M331_9CYAN|nr:hypothetical protein NIES267_74060 [Calothrix parasitica NIES-267]